MDKSAKTPIIISVTIVLAILFLILAIYVYKLVKEAGTIAQGAIQDKAVSTAISNSYGIDTSRASVLRQLSQNIADELGTGSNSGWMGTWGNSDETKIIAWLNQVQSGTEMQALKSIYETDTVPGHNFYADLDDALSSYDFQDVRYSSFLQ